MTPPTCPNCGHQFTEADRVKGGKARWKGTTKKQRSQAAKAAITARWDKHRATKAKARSPKPPKS